MLCLLSVSAALGAPLQYRVVTLDLPSGSTSGIATAINNHGQAVGYVEKSGVRMPVLWSNGSVTELGLLGGSLGEANDINDFGQVVGISSTSQGNRAFLWDSGVLKNIGNVSQEVFYTTATTITNSGHIYGSYFAIDTKEVAVEWTNPGKVDLPRVAFGPFTFPFSNVYSANEVGQVVGEGEVFSSTKSMIFQNGNSSLLAFASINNSADDTPMDINDLGIAVGTSWINVGGQYRPLATRYEGGVAEFLEMLPGATDSGAGEINNAGIILGTNSFGSGPSSPTTYVYWDETGVHPLLDSLLNPIDGLTISGLSDMNELGWITGYGVNTEGYAQPLMLVPVPELPSVITIVIVGLVVGFRFSINYRSQRRIIVCG